MKNLEFILASGSPRRRELLLPLFPRLTIRVPSLDETPLPRETPKDLVKRLSIEKAKTGIQFVRSDRWIVLAADTVVVTPDGRKVLGKPRSSIEAARMLGLLSGRTHNVLTGFSVMGTVSKKVRLYSQVVTTQVTFRKLSKDWIRFYLTTGEPMDKAGAYAAQGIGATMIEKVTGSYTNVIGLPMAELLKELRIRYKVEPSVG